MAGSCELGTSIPYRDIVSGVQSTWRGPVSCGPAYLTGTLVWSPVYMAGSCELETSVPYWDIGLESSLHGENI